MKFACMLFLTIGILVLLSLVNAAIEAGTLEIRLVKNSWNAIGIPYKDAIIDDSDCKGKYYSKIYYWDPYELKYKHIDSLRKMEGGKGYWVYAKDSCVIRVKGWNPIRVNDVTFHTGWNFVSGMKANGGDATKEDLMEKCDVKKSPYYYNPIENKWETVDKLEEGKGYWVYCRRLILVNCKLDESNWRITCDTTCKQAEGKPTIAIVIDKDKNIALAYNSQNKSLGNLLIKEGQIIFSTEPSLSMLDKDKSKWKVIIICSQPDGKVSEVGVR